MVVQKETESRIVHTVLLTAEAFVQCVQIAGREGGPYGIWGTEPDRDGDRGNGNMRCVLLCVCNTECWTGREDRREQDRTGWDGTDRCNESNTLRAEMYQT